MTSLVREPRPTSRCTVKPIAPDRLWPYLLSVMTTLIGPARKLLLITSRKLTLLLVAVISLSTTGSLFGRTPPILRTPETDNSTWAWPAYSAAQHNVGNMALAVSNHGVIGTTRLWRDTFTNQRLWACEYPKDSRTKYLYSGELWVGAIINGDTLVSTGSVGSQEFHPDNRPMGFIQYRSTMDPMKPEFVGAVSEQDFIAVYADTCRRCSGVRQDGRDSRGHIPLMIEVTQRSMAWSYQYADDFVLLDYSIKNIGQEDLKKVYVGFFVDADILTDQEDALRKGWWDDICGFMERQPARYLQPHCPPDSDVVNLAWTADNDGGFVGPQQFPVRNVTATRIIRTPRDSLRVSFNWWAYDRGLRYTYFGPQTQSQYREMFGDGYPVGDRDYYHMLSNGEFDYDQPRIVQIGDLDSVWTTPSVLYARGWATGMDTRYLLSFGPFTLAPGRSLPITLAYVGGINFHTHPTNFAFLPDNPDMWYEVMDFAGLSTNATWAEWVYDNPGVDTDSDGYAGEFTICNLGDDSVWVCDTLIDSSAHPDTSYLYCRWNYEIADTVWRKGDGVPDFRGAMPPAAPVVRVYPSNGRVRIVWNGAASENSRDIFSREIDFEGYRVYVGRDERRSSFSIVASFDRENWNRYVWDYDRHKYTLEVRPMTLDELRCEYADSCGDTTWHPDHYPRTRPLVVPNPKGDDEICYFTPQDYNRSVLANDPINATTPIRKTYPDAPKPPIIDVDSIRILYPNGEDTLFLTDNGFIKCYEYEYTLEGLLPSVSYWINVTAFDYGSPTTGLNAMETNPATRPQVTMAMAKPDTTGTVPPEVYVYPNPYRVDVDYRDRGFEGRGHPELSDDRARQINFANLPPKCTITIFSLDGDQVRQIKHDADPSDPMYHIDYWDLITRNSQQPVSGLYYWTVEDDNGHIQIGKLVLIM